MEKGNKLFHKLDRYLGVPIVFALGLLSRRRRLPTKIGRLAILNTGSIGDNVLMSASLSDLRVNFPESEVVVFTGATNFQLVSQLDKINKVVKLPIANPAKAIQMVKSFGTFDALIDFGPWPRINSIYSFFIPAKFKIGFRSQGQFRHYVYDFPVDHSDQKHELENYRSLISPLVAKPSSTPSIRNIGTAKSKEIIRSLASYCIIHPWPGGYKSYMKEWGTQRWVGLIDLIHKDFDKVVITGAPEDFAKTEQLVSRARDENKIDNLISLAGKTDLKETIDVLANSRIIFSVNTGIAHIAASFDLPQICLHGPTNPKRWRPYSANTISVVPSSGKFGYLNFGFEYELAEGNCMDDISVDSVYNAYASLNGSKSRSNV